MLEPQELQHAVALVAHGAREAVERGHGGVREVVHHAAVAHGVAHEAVDDGACGRVVGERRAHDGVRGGAPADAPDALLHAQRELDVRVDDAHRLAEARLQMGLPHDVEWGPRAARRL